MPFVQAPVQPPPQQPLHFSRKSKTVVITRGTSAVGLHTARQLLIEGASLVVLAVRDIVRGRACKTVLLSDPTIVKSGDGLQFLNPRVRVIALDMDDFDSVQAFLKILCLQLPTIDYLVLNSGIALKNPQITKSGYEIMMQRYYLSNTLLITRLLPQLEASAKQNGLPARITWIGSRTHYRWCLGPGLPTGPHTSVFRELNATKDSDALKRYRDTQLLCAMFMYELAACLIPTQVTINMVCPGMVKTDDVGDVPRYRLPMQKMQADDGQSPENAAWLILNAMFLARPKSHGRFLEGTEIVS
ncbi:MAG: hypothetical protein Q9166_005097 [cf. Caloplaca sp. 2 TL-2023]